MGCNNTSVLNENAKNLFEEISLGKFTLRNRIAMAAMTRMRTTDGTPNDLYVEYYSQRANDAGLIITECLAVSDRGEGFPGNCQAFTEKHKEGWKKVIDEVHRKKGVIFGQLVHAGRAAAKAKLNGQIALAPSAILNRSRNDYETPKEMTKEEIKEVINEFIHSAKLLKEAGIDGIEIHSANGYLIDQFLRDGTNTRTDEYGGSVENRSRFFLEIMDEMIKLFGANRVGCKLTPVGRYNDMFDSKPKELLDYLLKQLNSRKIAFVELSRADGQESKYEIKGEDQIKDLYDGVKKLLPDVVLIGNSKFTADEANDKIKKKVIDMVSFATNYIANPDLAYRIANNFELAQPDWGKAFGGGKEGFSDYKHYEIKKEEVKK